MSWASASDFFAMGGYALFVWTAYGVTVLVLGGEALLARRRAARALALAQARTRARARARTPAGAPT